MAAAAFDGMRSPVGKDCKQVHTIKNMTTGICIERILAENELIAAAAFDGMRSPVGKE